MARRFARLKGGLPPLPPGYVGIPSDGMCLNVFLILRPPNDPGRVLLGRVAPDLRWEEVGGLDPSRVKGVSDRWILPASQLLLLEGPDAAARRIGQELLGIHPDPLPPPTVFSETYRRSSSEGADPHWDLHFMYSLDGPAVPPRHPLWKELEYVRVAETPRTAFARGHGDVLELAGLPPAD
jgi:hypothetical protein